MFAAEERGERRFWRPDLDEVAVAAAIDTFRRSWPAFDEWWTAVSAQLPAEEREIPPEPFEAAIRTYRKKTGR